MARFSIRFLVAAVMTCGPSVAQETVAISIAEAKRLHEQLKPARQDWQSIPWNVDLTAARRAAVAKKRLLFMWTMNGHPLGCT